MRLGIPIEEASLIRCGRRMRLDVERAGHDGMYTVSYPAFRSDGHMVDIFEGGATLTSESVRGILGELHPAVITGSSIRNSIASGDEAPFLDEPVAYAELELRRVF